MGLQRCRGVSVCACVCAHGCVEQRLMTVYSSSSVYPFVFLKSGCSFRSHMSGCGFPPLPMPLIWKGVHLNLQTSVFFRVIFSLCVTWRWKRDGAKQLRNQVVCVKSSVSKANPEWAVFCKKETEPFGRRVFLLGQHGQVKRVFGAWWNRWDPCGHWHAILPLPPTTGVLCICIKLIEA